MKNNITDTYYIFSLDEPAMPGFCSFDKMYVGTEKALRKVAENMTKKGSYPNTVKALEDYFNGNTAAKHNIAYREQQVLIPVKTKAEIKHSFENYAWTHTNIWGFPYNMKCDTAEIHQIIFKHEDTYFRCIRAWFKNLCYEGFNNNWNMLDDGFWGNGSVLDVSYEQDGTQFTFNNLLFVEEAHYRTLKAAVADMNDISKIEFKRICDEIFADG